MKTVVVTGTSRGIGRSLVETFAAIPNMKVIAISRNRELLDELEKIQQAQGTTVFGIPFDLSCGDYKNDLLPKIVSLDSKIDVLVNNAGYLVNKPFDALSEQDFDNLFNVNVKAVFKLTQLLIPFFNVDAHIVTISSMGGYQGSAKFPGLSLYSASKGAAAVLGECLAVELEAYGVKSNVLALGAVNTEMLADAFPGYEAPVNPQKMAEYISNFALTAHNYMNAKVIPLSLSTP